MAAVRNKKSIIKIYLSIKLAERKFLFLHDAVNHRLSLYKENGKICENLVVRVLENA